MEGINSFEKGLHRSNSPQEQPEGSYVDALNWIRNDSGRLINEELEAVMQSLTDATSYKYLGSCPIKDSFIIFFQQLGINGQLYSEIGMFDNTTNTYRRIFNDFFTNPSYRLNFSGEIDSVAKINSSGETIVYFVEKDNKPRRFNITAFENLAPNAYSNSIYNDVEDWKLELDFKMPYATYVVEKDGTLPSGTYAFAFRYSTGENNRTTFNIPSRFINIGGYVPFDQNGNPVYDDRVTGGIPQSQTNQKIVMTLQNLDPNYPFIEAVVITYLGISNVLTIKSLGLYENRNGLKINFSSDAQYLNDISEKALLEMPVNINSATCIEQKDNVLVLSNITTKKFDKDFQKVANQIQIHFEIQEQSVDVRRNIQSFRRNAYGHDPAQGLYSLTWLADDPITSSFYGDTATKFYSSMSPSDAYRPSTSFDRNFQKSNVYADPFILKGFTRGEVYSFSIAPIYKDGSVGFAYHIPGTNSTLPNTTQLKPWFSDYTYPSMYQDLDPTVDLRGKIRHHQIPDFNDPYYQDVIRVSPGGQQTLVRQNVGVPYIGNDSTINILRIRVQNIKFTPEQLKNIQGYVIGYQPRNNDVNTRIIDNGFTRPYLKNEQRDEYLNSLWTGQVIYCDDINGNRSEDTWKPVWSVSPYAMYHSPDTLLDNNKVKAGYKIETIGYGGNSIIHAARPGTFTTNGVVSGYDDRWETFTKYGLNPYYVKFRLPINSWSSGGSNGIVNNPELFLNLFFEFNDYIPFKGPKVDITEQDYIGAVGANNTTTIDSKITLRYSSEYLHLKTNGTHFSFNDAVSKKYYSDIVYQVTQDVGTDTDGWRMFDPGWYGYTQNPRDYSQKICINLARIRNDISFQYGQLENAQYTVAGFELDDGGLAQDITIEGDTYISKYFFNILDRIYGKSDGDQEYLQGRSIMGVYVESKNNYSFRHADDAAVPFYPNYKSLHDTSNTNYGLFNYEWWKVSTGYNRQYSAIAGPKLTFSKPLFFKEISEYTNRSVYSNQAFESELVDQYRVFKSTAFHDIPKHRGIITDTFVFNNTFYHHTEYGLWQSFFNPNTIQSTSQGDVVLGNAGIFNIPSKLVLDIKGGYMGTMDKSGTNTPFGRVFLDHKQSKIFLFAGESPVEISDLGLFSFFREFVNTTDKYSMGYDWANKRLLISNQEKTISFYPKTQTWTSFHDFGPTVYFTTNGYSYAWKDAGTSFYNLDNPSGIRKQAYVTFVENTQPDAFKRFDRIEMNTMSGGVGGILAPGAVLDTSSYEFINKSFTHIHCWTDRQNSTELQFDYPQDYDTAFNSSYNFNLVPVNYYRSSFHAELPLDAVIDPYVNIFDSNNLDINADFRAHMKGKFLYTKLSYKDNKPLVLNYVKTFFKPTVA